MALTRTDWIVIATYLLLNLLISLYYRRRSSGSTRGIFCLGAQRIVVAGGHVDGGDYFCRGYAAAGGGACGQERDLGQLAVVVAVFVRNDDGFFLCALLAPRGNSDGRGICGAALRREARGFSARLSRHLSGALMNCLILGWVIKAMISITLFCWAMRLPRARVLQIGLGGHVLLHYTLGAPAHTALLICVLILVPFTGIYTFIGGLWGVLVTDLFQFILKMTMIVVLAWIAVAKLGGMTLLKIQLSAM